MSAMLRNVCNVHAEDCDLPVIVTDCRMFASKSGDHGYNTSNAHVNLQTTTVLALTAQPKHCILAS